MFTISVETHFRASHQLTMPDGSKEPQHSHNWIVSANVSSRKLNSMGLVMDFGRLKAMLDEIVAQFQDVSLDETVVFRRNNSSAENVAEYIYGELRARLPKGVRLRCVTVVEEPGCSAGFTPDEPNNGK